MYASVCHFDCFASFRHIFLPCKTFFCRGLVQMYMKTVQRSFVSSKAFRNRSFGHPEFLNLCQSVEKACVDLRRSSKCQERFSELSPVRVCSQTRQILLVSSFAHAFSTLLSSDIQKIIAKDWMLTDICCAEVWVKVCDLRNRCVAFKMSTESETNASKVSKWS